MMSKEKEINDTLEIINGKGISFQDLMRYQISKDIERFEELTAWSKKDYEEYSILLKKAQDISKNNKSGDIQKEVGDILELLVKFVIEKTYFFETIENVRTKTNEIDLYISLSKEGIQALETYNLSRDLLVIPEKEFIAECKNYNTNIGSTWYGKFYAVMKTCDFNFGILFSLKRATGNFDKWSDSYGLIRTLTLVEKYANNKQFHLIDFGLSDFEAINPNNSFFDIIKNKMTALRLGVNYDNFIKKITNDLDEEKKEKLEKIKILKS